MAVELSNAEWKVMNVVWRHESVTVRDVYEFLEPETGWAYSTCKTILSRLVDKGALGVTKSGQTSRFSSRIERDTARRSALQGLMERAFDGGVSPLMQFLLADQSMTESDRTALREMLDAEEQRTKKQRRGRTKGRGGA